MISAECPRCESSIAAPDETSGKSVKCPKCGHVFWIPTEPPVVLGRSALRPKKNDLSTTIVIRAAIIIFGLIFAYAAYVVAEGIAIRPQVQKMQQE